MGQGRKKCAKSGAYRYRRRSVALDVEEQEAKTVMSYLGAPSGMRHNSFSYNRTRYTQRESQPSQVMIRPRHDSLVEYMSSSSTPSLPIKKPNICSQPPLAGDQHVTDSIPFISTAPTVPTLPSDKCRCCLPSPPCGDFSSIGSCKEGVDLLLRSLFPNSTIYMNGKARDLTSEMRENMASILIDVLKANGLSVDPSLSHLSTPLSDTLL